MRLEGRITIGRQQHTNGDDTMHVELIDDISGIHFAEVYLSLEDFARAVTGQEYIHCALEVRGLTKVGMQREHKTEVVPYRALASRTEKDEAKAAALAPFEVDGWTGYAPDLGNMHCRVPGQAEAYRVKFSRHVPREVAERVAGETK